MATVMIVASAVAPSLTVPSEGNSGCSPSESGSVTLVVATALLSAVSLSLLTTVLKSSIFGKIYVGPLGCADVSPWCTE